MAYGSHWEWRGFGGVSGRFAKVFSELESIYSEHGVIDKYLWFPGMKVNIKLRQGTENGLKFKHLEKKEGAYEAWNENEQDFFPFPLDEEARESLMSFITESDLREPATPLPHPATYTDTLNWLQKSGCQFITVEKTRESKVWHGDSGSVLVEWACIRSPQSIVSIGLENYYRNQAIASVTESDKMVMEEAVKKLALEDEPLTVINYLKAIEIWAANNKL